MLYLYLNLCSCKQQSFFILAGSCYGQSLDMTLHAWLWCMAMTLNCPQIQSQASINFFKIFSGVHAPNPNVSMLYPCWLMVLHTIAIILNCSWLAWPLKNCFLRPWSQLATCKSWNYTRNYAFLLKGCKDCVWWGSEGSNYITCRGYKKEKKLFNYVNLTN